MGYREEKKNTRRQNARFSVNEWIEFRKRLYDLKENHKLSERDFRILEEIIVNQKTTAELAYYSRHDKNYSWLRSNQKKPISVRRIQQILTDHFPEFHIQLSHKRIKTVKEMIRQQQRKIKEEIELPKRCGRCNSTEDIELHHLIPVSLGGGNDKRNLIFLCHDCHKNVSLYYSELLREDKIRFVTSNEIYSSELNLKDEE